MITNLSLNENNEIQLVFSSGETYVVAGEELRLLLTKAMETDQSNRKCEATNWRPIRDGVNPAVSSGPGEVPDSPRGRGILSIE